MIISFSKSLLNHKRYNLTFILLFFTLMLIIFVCLFSIPQPDITRLGKASGFYDLSGSDFTNTVYQTADYWESWPEQLLAPEDLNKEASPSHIKRGEYKSLNYATHRIRLKLPPGRTYGISLQTSEYAMRIFIDGGETDSVGTPGTTREETVPRVLERTYYFTPGSGQTEIVVQAANFVHGKGGAWPPRLIIGTHRAITQRDNAALVFSFIVVGCLLTSFLYHMGLFCLNRNRKTVLMFAICSLLLMIMQKKLYLVLFPDYNWYIGIRVEYIVHFLTFVTLVLLINMLHPKLLHKAVVRIYSVIAAVYILMTLVTGTLFFTSLLVYFDLLSLLMIAYVLTRMFMALRGGTAENYLSLIGILAIGLLGANDILYFRGFNVIPPASGQFFMTPVGMVIFVFCFSLVMSLSFERTEQAMRGAQERERRFAVENASLDRLNRLKTDLMTTISHEARTPLAVLASYSGLVSMELRDKGVDIQTASDLDNIAFEAKRVAELIDSMKRLTLQRGDHAKRIRLDLGETILQTARLYRHILERGGVKLLIEIEENLPLVFGSPEELTQVSFNLLQNAKNHTAQGSVTVTVKREGDYIAVSVEDTGDGVPPELLPRVFERGIHGNGEGTGIGLSICKEIIEAHGGTIKMESEHEKGTAVTFFLPVYEEGI